MSCFNVFFTFLPPMAIGVFDQFTSARLLDKYPQMYTLGQRNEFFNQKRFWGWIFNAVYHSAVSCYLKKKKKKTKSCCRCSISWVWLLLQMILYLPMDILEDSGGLEQRYLRLR